MSTLWERDGIGRSEVMDISIHMNKSLYLLQLAMAKKEHVCFYTP